LNETTNLMSKEHGPRTQVETVLPSRNKILDENAALLAYSRQLLQQKAEVAQLQKGPLRESLLARIEEWFNSDAEQLITSLKANEHLPTISWRSLQEMWDAWGKPVRQCIEEGCSPEVVNRLRKNDPVRPGKPGFPDRVPPMMSHPSGY